MGKVTWIVVVVVVVGALAAAGELGSAEPTVGFPPCLGIELSVSEVSLGGYYYYEVGNIINWMSLQLSSNSNEWLLMGSISSNQTKDGNCNNKNSQNCLTITFSVTGTADLDPTTGKGNFTYSSCSMEANEPQYPANGYTCEYLLGDGGSIEVASEGETCVGVTAAWGPIPSRTQQQSYAVFTPAFPGRNSQD